MSNSAITAFLEEDLPFWSRLPPIGKSQQGKIFLKLSQYAMALKGLDYLFALAPSCLPLSDRMIGRLISSRAVIKLNSAPLKVLNFVSKSFVWSRQVQSLAYGMGSTQGRGEVLYAVFISSVEVLNKFSRAAKGLNGIRIIDLQKLGEGAPRLLQRVCLGTALIVSIHRFSEAAREYQELCSDDQSIFLQKDMERRQFKLTKTMLSNGLKMLSCALSVLSIFFPWLIPPLLLLGISVAIFLLHVGALALRENSSNREPCKAAHSLLINLRNSCLNT